MSNRQEPLVMVITAWHDEGGVRARIVHGDRGARHTIACGSVQDLLDLVRDVMVAWEHGQPAAPED